MTHQQHKTDSRETLSKSYANASALYQVGDYRRAEAIFISLIEIEPLNANYWFGFGSCLQMRRDYREALSAWRMASLLNDLDPICHFHAAECCFSLNKINEGLSALKAAQKRTRDKVLCEKISSLKQCWESKEG